MERKDLYSVCKPVRLYSGGGGEGGGYSRKEFRICHWEGLYSEGGFISKF